MTKTFISSCCQAVPDLRTVVFGDTTCKVDANGYFCNGRLSEEDKAKLEQIKAELK